MATRSLGIVGDKSILNVSPLYRQFQLFHLNEEFYLEPHSHNFYHVNLIMSGSVNVGFGGQTHTVREGQAVILPPFVPHAISTDQGYAQIGIDMYPHEDENGMYCFFQESFPQGFAVIPLIHLPRNYGQMHKYFKDLTTLNRLRVVNIIDSLLLMVIEHSKDAESYNFRRQFLELMAMEDSCFLSLEEICKALNLSRTHLERLCKKEFGCGAIEYCNKLRLLDARQYLEKSRMSIKEICEALRFYDEGHFIRFFKKRMGTTPHQYRLQYKQSPRH